MKLIYNKNPQQINVGGFSVNKHYNLTEPIEFVVWS